MKSASWIRWTAPLCGVLLGLSLLAQEDSPTTSDREGQVVAPVGSTTTDSINATVPSFNRTDLADTIRERLLNFEQLRQAYLLQQRGLIQKLRGASEEERDKIREEIRQSRQAWLDQARQLREQARERLQELRDRLPNHREILDAAREQARDQVRDQIRDGLEEAREQARRGTD